MEFMQSCFLWAVLIIASSFVICKLLGVDIE